MPSESRRTREPAMIWGAILLATLALAACTTPAPPVKVEPYNSATGWYGCTPPFELRIHDAAAVCIQRGGNVSEPFCPTAYHDGKPLQARYAVDAVPSSLADLRQYDQCIYVAANGTTVRTTNPSCQGALIAKSGRDTCHDPWVKFAPVVRGGTAGPSTYNNNGRYHTCPRGFLFVVAPDRRGVKCVGAAGQAEMEYELRDCSLVTEDIVRTGGPRVALDYKVDYQGSQDWCVESAGVFELKGPAITRRGQPQCRPGYQLREQAGRDACVNRNFPRRYQTEPTEPVDIRDPVEAGPLQPE